MGRDGGIPSRVCDVSFCVDKFTGKSSRKMYWLVLSIEEAVKTLRAVHCKLVFAVPQSKSLDSRRKLCLALALFLVPLSCVGDGRVLNWRLPRRSLTPERIIYVTSGGL